MKYSVGLIDELFGEKTILEFTRPDGQIGQRQVTIKWHVDMISENKEGLDVRTTV
jgi:hypothetical protein